MCNVCNGHPFCPVCSDDIQVNECTHCDHGTVYLSEFDGEVDFETWSKLKVENRDEDKCERCGGNGLVAQDR